MAEILLSSESFIKTTTNVSDNLAGKYILPSLREAQEVGLRGILGDCLLAALKTMATPDPQTHTRPIDDPANAQYKALLDRAQYYLAYQTIVEVTAKVTYKVGNFGVAKASDENLQPVGPEELGQQQFYYQSKADAACFDLQRWLLDNSASFPELTPCACNAIRANLKSAASCGVFLGGPRGKILPGGGGCCKR